MDSQATQKATYDAHIKFREFYPGERALVRDLRKKQTWWPGSMAERSVPKSYVVALKDGRVWKRQLDHIKRNTMDSVVSSGIDEESQNLSQNTVPNPA